MEKITYLNLKIRKYLLQRKVFRTIEISASLTVTILLFAFGENFGNILACVVGLLLIPEAILFVHRSIIKSSIKDENLITKREIEFYSNMKADIYQDKRI